MVRNICYFIFICILGCANQKNYTSTINHRIISSQYSDEFKFRNDLSGPGAIPDAMPVFIGDIEQFVQSNIHYPVSALKDSIEGAVVIQCIVDNQGYTYAHEIVKGIRADVDVEALRVSKLIRFKHPASIRGNPIKYTYTLVVTFKMLKR